MVKKVDDMTIAEYIEYEEKIKRQYSRNSGSYFLTYFGHCRSSNNTTLKFPRNTYFNPIPPNMKFNYDSKDMELDEEAGYTTDKESVMKMEKYMRKQEEKNEEDALIAIIKSIREECKVVHKNKQIRVAEAGLKKSSKAVENIVNNDSFTSNLPSLEELNPGSFLLPFTINNYNSYVITNIDAGNNVMPRGIYEYLKLANLRGAGMYGFSKITKKQSKPDKIEHEIEKIAQKPDSKTFSMHKSNQKVKRKAKLQCMRTRSKSYPNATIPRRSNKRRVPNIVEPEIRTIEEFVPMADRTMEELLQEENLRRNLNNDMRSILGSFFQNQASTSGTLLSNIVPNPKCEMKAVTTRSSLAYEGPSMPTNSPLEKVVERDTEEITEKGHSNCQRSIAHIQPLLCGHSSLMPKFASTIKSLLMNKDKLFELAKVPLNENCSAMLLKKLPKKLGDPGKFLIPSDFPKIDVCHALADLGASINLMPLSIWKKLSLLELSPTRMNLKLVDKSITRPKGVAKDVFVKVGKFHFPTDFVVVDFEANPRVPLILGRSFLRIGRALIDVYGEEITLRVNDEFVTFNLKQTMRYSLTYDDNSMNRVDVIDIACEEFVQDVLDF
nr:reverse transcriptase domain-containing protein [Tanacetum cinerariifolium]